MIVENQKIRMKITPSNYNWYKNKGYNVKMRGAIEVDIKDLQKTSKAYVEVVCEECQEHFYRMYKSAITSYESGIGDFCQNCIGKRHKKVAQIKYGVDNVSQLPMVREKIIKTNLEKFGGIAPLQNEEIKKKVKETTRKKYKVDNVMQSPEIQEHLKNTMLEKYGVENYFNLPGVRDSIVKKTIKTKTGNKTVLASKNQIYIANLYEKDYNVLLGDYYAVDILFEEEKIYCEYDGKGHDLNVRLKNITQKDFEIKEAIRYRTLKDLGYKVFRIISKNDKLPKDDILLQIKEISFNYLKIPDNYYICFYINENKIKTHNGEYEWDYKKLLNTKDFEII